MTTSYQYNAKNELIGVSKDDGSTTASYQYNIDGIRNQKTESGNTTEYVVDSNQAYAQVIQEITNGTTQVSYAYGDDLISQVRAGSTSYYHVDGLGSTRSLSDSNGDITDTYDYEAFGELLNSTGTTENSYLYGGEQYDQSLDQYYLRARYYNQNIGRFTQQDTWMGNNHDPITLHKYLYANASPAMYTDPSGNFSLGSLMAGINTMGNLAMRAYNVYSAFDMGMSIASGEMSAKEIGTEILLNMLGGSAGKLIKMMPKKTQELLRKAYDGVECFFNSFPAGTMVHTENGLMSIEDVKIGDMVLAFDEETGELAYKEVTHFIQHEKSYNFVEIKLETGEVLEATAEHPFYVAGEWKQANELEAGDKLTLAYGLISVQQISREIRTERVYNFTVDTLHTYFIGSDGILVHNQNKKACKFRGRKAKGYDWDHIFDNHADWGNVNKQRTGSYHTSFSGLTASQIKARVKGAWKNRELVRTQVGTYDKYGVKQADRLIYDGIDPKSGQTVRMWFNPETGIVESAAPRM
ncbi:RHS repeat/hint domain-containing protein [Gynuella sunshinyii]|uniref:Rhs family protein n=1 Tax=Gynuella sunshinyii YC6258 TaxID=1445510 RepID=A0A0C5VBE6_9GAMM|nr:RHS repeat/hint domain-containing protein [Gynuella sunshinyii]AJQ96670.1 rhs family protein [Gynuella sunshinyii YC6258]